MIKPSLREYEIFQKGVISSDFSSKLFSYSYRGASVNSDRVLMDHFSRFIITEKDIKNKFFRHFKKFVSLSDGKYYFNKFDPEEEDLLYLAYSFSFTSERADIFLTDVLNIVKTTNDPNLIGGFKNDIHKLIGLIIEAYTDSARRGFYSASIAHSINAILIITAIEFHNIPKLKPIYDTCLEMFEYIEKINYVETEDGILKENFSSGYNNLPISQFYSERNDPYACEGNFVYDKLMCRILNNTELFKAVKGTSLWNFLMCKIFYRTNYLPTPYNPIGDLLSLDEDLFFESYKKVSLIINISNRSNTVNSRLEDILRNRFNKNQRDRFINDIFKIYSDNASKLKNKNARLEVMSKTLNGLLETYIKIENKSDNSKVIKDCLETLKKIHSMSSRKGNPIGKLEPEILNSIQNNLTVKDKIDLGILEIPVNILKRKDKAMVQLCISIDSLNNASTINNNIKGILVVNNVIQYLNYNGITDEGKDDLYDLLNTKLIKFSNPKDIINIFYSGKYDFNIDVPKKYDHVIINALIKPIVNGNKQTLNSLCKQLQRKKSDTNFIFEKNDIVSVITDCLNEEDSMIFKKYYFKNALKSV